MSRSSNHVPSLVVPLICIVAMGCAAELGDEGDPYGLAVGALEQCAGPVSHSSSAYYRGTAQTVDGAYAAFQSNIAGWCSEELGRICSSRSPGCHLGSISTDVVAGCTGFEILSYAPTPTGSVHCETPAELRDGHVVPNGETTCVHLESSPGAIVLDPPPAPWVAVEALCTADCAGQCVGDGGETTEPADEEDRDPHEEGPHDAHGDEPHGDEPHGDEPPEPGSGR